MVSKIPAQHAAAGCPLVPVAAVASARQCCVCVLISGGTFAASCAPLSCCLVCVFAPSGFVRQSGRGSRAPAAGAGSAEPAAKDDVSVAVLKDVTDKSRAIRSKLEAIKTDYKEGAGSHFLNSLRVRHDPVLVEPGTLGLTLLSQCTALYNARTTRRWAVAAGDGCMVLAGGLQWLPLNCPVLPAPWVRPGWSVNPVCADCYD